MKLHFVSAVVLFGVAAPAAADPHVEAAVGYRWGSALVDGVDVGHVGGADLQVGARLRGKLLLYGEYDLSSLTFPASPTGLDEARVGIATPTGSSGLEHRLGTNARYSFNRIGDPDGGMDFWAEAGAGIEHYVWDRGGVWTRGDFDIGLGTSMRMRSSGMVHGMTFSVRGTFAPKSNVGSQVSCGGPCDTPTAPTGWDRSVMWELALFWGN